MEVVPGEEGVPAWVCDPEGPAFRAADRVLREAFGVSPVYMGMGGSIPFVAPLSAAFGGAPALLLGPADPGSRIHSEDESVSLDDLRRHILAEALLFGELARRMGKV